jgi:AAA ATPase domain
MTSPAKRLSVYNPGLLHRDELIAGFVARTELLDYLVEDLRQGGRQHHLIIGQRGAGKTTLLLRLACAVEDDAKLSKQAIALRFPEEQYNVARLSDFWLNCLDALVDALEQRGALKEAARLDEKIAQIEPLEEAERQRASLETLVQWAERERRIVVLLIDNLDLVLQRLPDEHWSLRETLSQQPRLALIGASSTFLEESSDYGAAFYEFFNLHELGALDDDEARRMLLRLTEQSGNPRAKEVLEQEPGRVKALLLLSGGTPRTLMLLHGILAEGTTSRAEEDLEALLDQVTPYYKARFDDLSAQSQQIVDVVALNWHPISAVECDRKVRMGTNATSALLNRLTKQGVLTKQPGADSSKLTFQIRERLFNIWYLMRASRRLRRKLIWLVGFLQSFYGEIELAKRASELLESKHEQDADPARLLALASAVTDVQLRRHLELRAAKQIILHVSHMDEMKELLDLEGEDQHLARLIDRVRALNLDTSKASPGGAIEQQRGSPEVRAMIARQALIPLKVKRELLGPGPQFDEEFTEEDLRLLGQDPAIDGLVLMAIGAKSTGASWLRTGSFIQRLLELTKADSDSPLFLPAIWREFVKRGLSNEVADLLRDVGKHELAPPLYEALRAAGRGLTGELTYLAPEIRDPAEQILRELLASPEEEARVAALPPAPPRRAPRKKKPRAASK